MTCKGFRGGVPRGFDPKRHLPRALGKVAVVAHEALGEFARPDLVEEMERLYDSTLPATIPSDQGRQAICVQRDVVERTESDVHPRDVVFPLMSRHRNSKNGERAPQNLGVFYRVWVLASG